MEHHIYIDGFIGQGDIFFQGYTLKDLRAAMDAGKKADTLVVHINSGGGSVTEGFAIYDALINSGKEVETIVEGLCGSIATIIAQAGKKKKRKMYANSEYFIHNPYWQPSAPEPLESADLLKLSDELARAEEKILNFYVAQTGAEKEKIQEMMKAQTSMSAQEAVEFGFIDEIIGDSISAYTKHYISANGKDYRIAAFINKNNNTMTQLEQMFANFEAKLTAMFKPQIKNGMIKLKEGEVTVYFDGEEIAVGAAVYIDEAMTQVAPDGEHLLETEKVIVVKDGKVEEIKEYKEEVEALKSEIETLKAQLAEKETAVQNAVAEKKAVEAKVEEVKTEFVNFKNQVLTGKQEAPKGTQNFKGEGNAPNNQFDVIANKIKNKLQNN